MSTVKTTRVRNEWVDQLLNEYGTITDVAEEMGVDKSTTSRWLSGKCEASPRFIGSALLTFPVSFDDAFEVVEEIDETSQTAA